MQWNNLPQELRQLSQWIVSGTNKVPIDPRTGNEARVNDPSTWASFEEATKSGYPNIGFVLSKSDPYTIIDLDNKPNNPATSEQLQRHTKILDAFVSYTEYSVSGSGLHIIVKGSIPHGVNRDKIEVYSDSRYMICTGNVFRNVPILDYSDLLNKMYQEMAKPEFDLIELEEESSDQEIIERATHAADADKFNQLCKGEWELMGYPSQSEADLALISILCFYSKSNEQVRRLFRISILGQRAKSEKNDKYLDYCLKKVRGNEPPPIDFDIKPKLSTNGINGQTYQPSTVPSPPNSILLSNTVFPPGLIGEIASYIYESSIRPVREASLAASLGLCAGVIGRAYNISGTGLNQYIIFVARTGTGKEGMKQGINRMLASVRAAMPHVDMFRGPDSFASGTAFVKQLGQSPCFVSIQTEFGLTLQELCNPRANPSQSDLFKRFLEFYNMSGYKDYANPRVFSDSTKNTKLIRSPSITLLCESTPETFFEALNATHIERGLVPRFIVIEYTGDRPQENELPFSEPEPDLAKKFAELVNIGLININNETACCLVQTDFQAAQMLKEFNSEIDYLWKQAGNDCEQEIWNRTQLKAKKLAALVAVGINPHTPSIDINTAQWAIDFVRRDSNLMIKKFSSGEIGKGDSKIRFILLGMIKDYYSKYDQAALMKYGATEQMIIDGTVPHGYLSRRTAPRKDFVDYRLGAAEALKHGLKQLEDEGLIQEIPRIEMQRRYGTAGKAYKPTPRFDKTQV